MATTAEREAKERERDAARRNLQPGAVIPPWMDAEIVAEEQAARAKRSELYLRDEGNPTGPPMLNPNHPLGKALEGTVSNGSRLEALLTMLVAKQAGFDIGVQPAEEPEKKGPEAVTGSVKGGAPEGSVGSSPTTGPSATGGATGGGRSAEDARAAAGALPKREERR